MRIPLKKIGRFVGISVGKELGVIPDKTELTWTPAMREDFVQAVAEGVYAAMRQLEEDERDK